MTNKIFFEHLLNNWVDDIMTNVIEQENALYKKIGQTVNVSEDSSVDDVIICKIAIKFGESIITPALASMMTSYELNEFIDTHKNEIEYVNVPVGQKKNAENLFIDHVLIFRIYDTLSLLHTTRLRR